MAPGASFTKAPSKARYPGPSFRVSAGLARMKATLSLSVTGSTDDRVTTMPTTRSRSLRGGTAEPGPVPDPGRPAFGSASMVSVLPTCRRRAAAAVWSTAISPAWSSRGSRPASTRGASRPCPRTPARRSLGGGRPVQPPGPVRGLHVQADAPGEQRHARLPGQRAVEAGRPDSGHRDQQVGGVRRAQETRIGAAGPPGPRGGGHDRAARQRDQQDEHRPGPPAGSELVRDEEQHHPHQAPPPRAPSHTRSGLRPPRTERLRPPWHRA